MSGHAESGPSRRDNAKTSSHKPFRRGPRKQTNGGQVRGRSNGKTEEKDDSAVRQTSKATVEKSGKTKRRVQGKPRTFRGHSKQKKPNSIIKFHCNVCGVEFDDPTNAAAHFAQSRHRKASVAKDGVLTKISCQKCSDNVVDHLNGVKRGARDSTILCNRCLESERKKSPAAMFLASKDSKEKFFIFEQFFRQRRLDADKSEHSEVRHERSSPPNISESGPEPTDTSDPRAIEINEIIKSAELSSEPVYVSKLKRLRDLILNTTPKEPALKFGSMKEYLQEISYALFLEESFDTDIFTNAEVDSSIHIGAKEDISVITPMKESMETLPEYMRHLRQSPFTRSQAIIVMSRQDSSLAMKTKPNLWYCNIQFSKNKFEAMRGHGKHGKKGHKNDNYRDKKILLTVLHLFPWNSSTIPSNLKQIAILPCSSVITRVFTAMENLSNPLFEQLLLGQKPIKNITFTNRISHYRNQLNDSQKAGLQSALNNKITVLKGPPGSGKTSTIYEMITQLIDQLSYYPVLVVAASNLAVDNIAEKLMENHKDSILRIVSISKEPEYGSGHPLADICLHNKLKNILPPLLREDYMKLTSSQSSLNKADFTRILSVVNQYSLQFVKQAKVIFSTTVGISGPHLKNIEKLPVIIMDEATQTSEPSCLIPLAAQGIKKIVFVGDEAQLSAFTRVRSLEMSLFERCLKNGTWDHPVMLDTQYRMHPEISEFPRNKFYDGLLKDGVTAEDRTLPNVNYPLFFLDHEGAAGRERVEYSRSGYSLYNPSEVSTVERIVEMLLVDKQVDPQNIGIMTGYAAQRDHLSKALESNRLINPEGVHVSLTVDKEDLDKNKNVTVCDIRGIIIATVDAFQGREKDFIIMSCVRSNSEGKIGFLKDRRRMNVALTRARCSLIFSGDATCLGKGDPLWKEYIDYLRSKDRIFTDLKAY
ncbi:DEKNAAC100549 [Brettanomyces naardenensis]|uniref:DEKNAAC100549 n=1 Tax=Brettanomyces naardenensis TaxID=13370 RepID=A0A448YG64_BRENA|nr:DEKNAAC100549 [Brettanomyces naardenensis]